MDGSMWYANGGGGIFEHVDGPFAGPNFDPVVEAEGFGGVPGVPGDGWPVMPGLAGFAGVRGVSGDGWPVMPGLAGFGALGADGTAMFTDADNALIARETDSLIKSYASGTAKSDEIDRAIQAAGAWSTQSKKSTVWLWVLGGSALVIGGIVVWGTARRRRAS